MTMPKPNSKLPLDPSAFRHALDAQATPGARAPDLDILMALGRRAAAHPWGMDVLHRWLEAQPPSPRVIDVTSSALLGYWMVHRALPDALAAALARHAEDVGMKSLGEAAANTLALALAGAIELADLNPETLKHARRVLTDLQRHAVPLKLQEAPRDALARALGGTGQPTAPP